MSFDATVISVLVEVVKNNEELYGKGKYQAKRNCFSHFYYSIASFRKASYQRFGLDSVLLGEKKKKCNFTARKQKLQHRRDKNHCPSLIYTPLPFAPI